MFYVIVKPDHKRRKGRKQQSLLYSEVLETGAMACDAGPHGKATGVARRLKTGKPRQAEEECLWTGESVGQQHTPGGSLSLLCKNCPLQAREVSRQPQRCFTMSEYHRIQTKSICNTTNIPILCTLK